MILCIVFLVWGVSLAYVCLQTRVIECKQFNNTSARITQKGWYVLVRDFINL